MAPEEIKEITIREYLEASISELRRAVDASQVSSTEHIASLVDDLQDQLDYRIASQERQLALTQEQLTSANNALDERIKAILDENRRGLDVASQEREKAASALRAEQQRALELAEREREKAAVQIRANLEAMIAEGDANLRTHITEQIRSVSAALEAQQRLGDEKDKRLEAIHHAAQKAIDKAEVGMERRLHLLNEFRAQLSDQAKEFATRELMDQGFTQARREREQLNERVNRVENGALPVETFDRTVEEWTGWRATVQEQLFSGVTRKEYDKDEDDLAVWKQRVEERLNEVSVSKKISDRQQDLQGVSTASIIGWVGLVIAGLSVIAAILVGSFT